MWYGLRSLMCTFPAVVFLSKIYKLTYTTRERILLTLTRPWNFDDSLAATLWAMGDKALLPLHSVSQFHFSVSLTPCVLATSVLALTRDLNSKNQVRCRPTNNVRYYTRNGNSSDEHPIRSGCDLGGLWKLFWVPDLSSDRVGLRMIRRNGYMTNIMFYGENARNVLLTNTVSLFISKNLGVSQREMTRSSRVSHMILPSSVRDIQPTL